MDRPTPDGKMILLFNEPVPDILDNDPYTLRYTQSLTIPFHRLDPDSWKVAEKFPQGQMLLVYLNGMQHHFNVNCIKYMCIIPNSPNYRQKMREFEELQGVQAITEGYQSQGWEKASG